MVLLNEVNLNLQDNTALTSKTYSVGKCAERVFKKNSLKPNSVVKSFDNKSKISILTQILMVIFFKLKL